MSTGGLILILFVLALLGVLALAGKPSRLGSLSAEDTLAILSGPSHTAHLFPVLQALQNEFECLLAASRTLAVMSPQLVPLEEFERLKLNIRFALLCRYMRIRLRFGLSSQGGFDMLSAMAARISIALEGATVAAAEKAIAASE